MALLLAYTAWRAYAIRLYAIEAAPVQSLLPKKAAIAAVGGEGFPVFVVLSALCPARLPNM